MAFFLRKALKFGLLRLNLSKSGVGASVGVKGARVGLRSSDGQPYMYGGRYGLYCRQNLGSVAGPHVDGARADQIERAAEAIAELLDQMREEWLSAFQTLGNPNADVSVKKKAADMVRLSSETIVEHLKGMGFPIGTDAKLAGALSEIQSDLMLQAAFPEAYGKWDETCDELLGRAAKRAKQIVKKHQAETLTKLTKRQPLVEVVNDLAEKVVLPQLKSDGLVLEGNPVYEMRLASVVSGAIFDDLDRCIPE